MSSDPNTTAWKEVPTMTEYVCQRMTTSSSGAGTDLGVPAGSISAGA
jgi:hypothetical protein